ncbi:MAG: trimethylamine methyltransferase family protein, partial [Rhizobiales bacterium]|nr:trimethylamine methyltransferase family protein [Hyphomicrobiales bacterium]
MTRRSNRAERGGTGLMQRPFRQTELTYRPIEILSADQIMAIHRAALTILEEVGFKVLSERARELYRQGGADVVPGSDRVRFSRAMLMEWIGKAPAQFTLAARDPAKAVKVGGRHCIFASVGGPAYVCDLDKGRRTGTHAEQCDYLKLVQSLNVLHQEGGGPFEALDLDPRTRHLDLYYAQATLLDKNWQPQGLGTRVALDALDMAAISFATTREALRDRCVFTTVINTNSPLQLDIPMAEGLIVMAEHGQCNVITPFTLSGAMSPVTIAGSLAQQHAEAMAGIVLAQIVRPGVPVMYGGFTSNVDMKSGAPAFGTPEYTQAAQASGQLARLLKLPFRSSNVTAANDVDAQAAYESMMSLWGAVMGGANLVLHAAGWLNGGLTASFEKLIIDAELLQMMQAYCEPFAVTPETLALEAVRDVGPAGHFFGTAHTLARYQTAFYKPLLSNWDNYDSWVERGRDTAPQKANRIWKQLLADYQKPLLDPAIDDALKDFVA